ncbi:MAG: exosortase/archaeosortase family protein [Planctomycetota bacterium]
MTTAHAPDLRRGAAAPLAEPSGRPMVAWVVTGLIGVLFCAMFWNFLFRSFRFARQDINDWGHILIIPVLAGVLLYQRWDRLRALPIRPAWVGLPILVAGIVSYAFWIHPGRNDMLQGYSMIVALFGLVWLLFGTRAMPILSIPVLFLVLGVKISDRIWAGIALQLQHIAADLSTRALQVLTMVVPGFHDADRNGSVIELVFSKNGVLVHESLNVAEACAGLRMLMAFITLGAAAAFLVKRTWWQRVAMIGLAVPIAILVNCGRVTTLGLLYQIDPELASGDFHTFVGMLMLIPAAGLFLLTGWALERIVVREDSANAKSPPANAAPPAQPDAWINEPPSRPGAAAVVWAIISGLGVAATAVATYAVALSLPKPAIALPLVPTLLDQMLGPMLVIVGLPTLAAAVVASVLLWLVPLALPALRVPAHGGGTTARAQRLVAAAFVASLLGGAAVAQFSALHLSKAHLVKLPVPIERHLYEMPNRLGSWKIVRDSPPLSKDVLDELGTTEYISRMYQDTAAKDGGPGALVLLHMAYYTGTPDTVPHVPERCFVGGGATPVGGPDVVPLTVDSPMFVVDADDQGEPIILAPSGLARDEVRLPAKQFDATIFSFQGTEAADVSSVLYFFVANDKALATPDQVRAHGFSIADKHSYYCKVELQWFGVSDPEVVKSRSEAFLASAMPEIMACLPDWQAVQAGQWPPQEAATPPILEPAASR